MASNKTVNKTDGKVVEKMTLKKYRKLRPL